MSYFREYIDYAFFFIYDFIKSIEGGYASQTDSRRALLVIYLIALFVALNLFAFLQINLGTGITIIVWAIIVIFFYFVYYFNQRYKKISEKYKKKDDKPIAGGIITVLFILGSIIHFILRNPFGN